MNGRPTRGDAFGQMLLACLGAGGRSGGAVEIIERDDGFLDIGDGGRYFAGADEWGAAERQFVDSAAGNILDLGAGAGRHSLYLQERSQQVTALDSSPGAVDVCGQRGLASVVLGTASAWAMRRHPTPIDTYLMLGNNLGLLSSRDKGKRLLRSLSMRGSPRSVIIGGGLDPLQTSNPDHLAYQARNRRSGRLPGQVRIRVRYKQFASEWFDYLHLGPPQLRGLIKGTGWRMDELQEDGPLYLTILRRSD